jgi:hypothetical protein
LWTNMKSFFTSLPLEKTQHRSTPAYVKLALKWLSGRNSPRLHPTMAGHGPISL